MIWLASTNYIYVLHTGGGSFYSGGWLGRYPNPWSSGDPESDPSITPPDGRYQPLRGFGKVWRDNTRVRDALGWALAPEQGFTSAYQKEFLTCQVHPTGCDGWVPPEYLRLADGRIIALSFTVQHGYVPSWGYVNP